MSNRNPPQPVKTKTEAEQRSVDQQAGKTMKSGHDQKSHIKAGTQQGAGGGKKRERDH